ncbi:MAG TPA: glucose-1-phosphate adenylyltransferase [Usitatibacter sp.]|nr:glucose-1-phosphate adenylyltransferase [Usitatibacter sp.]
MSVVEEVVRAKRTESAPRSTRFSAHAARSTVALVLAGGRGSRLKQLTDWRAKPSVAFGGKFRIIDFTLSNCLNSGIRRIDIATQYKAHSLIRHVQRGWGFLDSRFDEFVEVLPAQQRTNGDWYQGTADAVYQNLDIIRRQDPKVILVLAGDHVYKMDYRAMIEEHMSTRAKMTVACVQAPASESSSYGVVRADERGRISGFQEKPLVPFTVPGRPDRVYASMGVYVFDAQFLYQALLDDAEIEGSSRDFGKDIIPKLVKQGADVYAHDFTASCVNMNGPEPYWRDVGTIDAYYDANIDLTHVVPELNLYDKGWPIWTYQEQIPPAKFVFDDDSMRGAAIDSIVSGGCIISGSSVRRSLLFTNVRVYNHSTIEDSVILPNVEIGPSAVVRNAVIDKHCKIPDGMQIGVDPAEDRRRFHVTERGRILVSPEMLGQHIHLLR